MVKSGAKGAVLEPQSVPVSFVLAVPSGGNFWFRSKSVQKKGSARFHSTILQAYKSPKCSFAEFRNKQGNFQPSKNCVLCLKQWKW
jgi:hypothetical protein